MEFTNEQFIADGHAKILLSIMNGFRLDQQFCDVVIEVEETKFPCHKCVVAAAIPFFKTMFQSNFKEAKLEHVPMTGVDSQTMNLILNYAYSGRILLTMDNVKDLIIVADYLGVIAVRNAACKYLEEHINESNCLQIYGLPDLNNLAGLRRNALQFALRNFEELSKEKEFLALSPKHLVDLLQSDDLTVPDEKIVFCAVMRWYDAQSKSEDTEFHLVMEKVRLCLLDAYFLHDCVNFFPIIKELPKIMELIDNAKLFHLLPDRYSSKFITQSIPRRLSTIVDAIVVVGGRTAKENISEVLCYLPTANIWRRLPPCPKSNIYIACNNNNKIFAAKFDRSMSFCWQYLPEDEKWIPKSSLCAWCCSLNSVDGFIYALTSPDEVRMKFIQRFDPAKNRWIKISEVNVPLSHYVTVTHNGMLYFVGENNGMFFYPGDHFGDQLIAKRRTFCRYDFPSKSLTYLPSMSTSRIFAGGCVLNDYIYIIGGVGYDKISNAEHCLNTAERYDINGGKWEFISSMIKPRSRHGVVTINGKIYAIGGKTKHLSDTDSVECYDPDTDKWETVARLPTPKSSFGYTTLKIDKERTLEIIDDSF